MARILLVLSSCLLLSVLVQEGSAYIVTCLNVQPCFTFYTRGCSSANGYRRTVCMRYDATPECIAAGGQADYHSGTLETPTGGVCYANEPDSLNPHPDYLGAGSKLHNDNYDITYPIKNGDDICHEFESGTAVFGIRDFERTTATIANHFYKKNGFDVTCSGYKSVCDSFSNLDLKVEVKYEACCDGCHYRKEGSCSKTCGTGQQKLVCDKPGCGHMHKFESCNTHSCPSGGNWCTWSSWGDCSVTCGVGRRLRTRQVGSHCSGQSSVDEEACILQSTCPNTGNLRNRRREQRRRRRLARLRNKCKQKKKSSARCKRLGF